MYDLHRPSEETIREFRLDNVIDDIATLLAGSCRERELTVATHLVERPFRIRQAEGILRQVLFNVIQNAIEASPRGGRITISAARRPKGLALAVTDEGAGVPVELVHRIFDPGFTTKQDTVASGLGLGLATCRSLVEAMKGEIWCENLVAPSHGAVFHVLLPHLHARQDEPLTRPPA